MPMKMLDRFRINGDPCGTPRVTTFSSFHCHLSLSSNSEQKKNTRETSRLGSLFLRIRMIFSRDALSCVFESFSHTLRRLQNRCFSNNTMLESLLRVVELRSRAHFQRSCGHAATALCACSLQGLKHLLSYRSRLFHFLATPS